MATPLQTIPFAYLTIIPILLAVVTVLCLILESDTNAALLWSQCHSRERLPLLTGWPVVGVPLCYLISFFHAALDSRRSALGVMAVVLAAMGALLTVSTVEAARLCACSEEETLATADASAGEASGHTGKKKRKMPKANLVILYPMGFWLVFNLVGGAVVWELVIIPAFLHWGKTMVTQRCDHDEETRAGDDADAQHAGRQLSDAEVVSVPLSIALGFFLPAVLMLVLNTSVIIGIWLFFPVYVSVLHKLIRYATTQYLTTAHHREIHTTSMWTPLVAVYATPVLCSLIAHGVMIWDLATGSDDRRELTRSTIKFIEVDVFFVALTVLYWMLVEVGWKVPLIMVVVSVVAGPGAGLCVGWMFREKEIHRQGWLGTGGLGSEEEEQHAVASEETPLLQSP